MNKQEIHVHNQVMNKHDTRITRTSTSIKHVEQVQAMHV